MNYISKALLFMIGFTIWMPGIAILNVSNSWGLQISMAFCLLLFILMLVNGLSPTLSREKINVKTEINLSHIALTTGLLICTIFSSLGFQRSILTFGVELSGVFFSFTLSWWFCKHLSNILIFFSGFWWGGMISCLYAIYQLVGLKSGFPFTYVEINNMSFSLLDIDSAIYHSRALGATPEPSILASLISMLLGMSVVKLLIEGSIRNYILLSIILVSLLATASQSIVGIPFYIGLLIYFIYNMKKQFRKLKKQDYIGIFIFITSGFFVFINNPDIGNVFSRLAEIDGGSARSQSSTSRFYDIIVFTQMFSNMPMIGNGLGATTELSESIRSSLNFDGQSGSSSGLFRLLAEQGLLSLLVMFTISKIINVRLTTAKESIDQRNFIVIGYSLACITSIIISLIFFVGYRSIYHTWLLIPMLLSFKCYSTRVSPVKQPNNIKS
jgi:hypothetical protein